MLLYFNNNQSFSSIRTRIIRQSNSKPCVQYKAEVLLIFIYYNGLNPLLIGVECQSFSLLNS